MWILAALLAFPFKIMEISEGGIGFALCDLAFLYILFQPNRVQLWPFWPVLVFMAISLLAAFTVPLLNPDLPAFRTLLSWGYFVKPYFGLLVGYAIVQGGGGREFVTKYGVMYGLFTIGLTPLIASSPIVALRTGINYYGIPLFGVSGANAFAVWNALSVMIAVAGWYSARGWYRLPIAAGILIGTSAVFLSVSRQSLIGLGLFLPVLLAVYWQRSVNTKAIFMLGGAVGAYFAAANMDAIIDAALPWQFKLLRDYSAIVSGDYGALSAGRLTIYGELLRITLANPLFSVGFSGFDVYRSDILEVAARYTSGLSPHQQYLGALWKMGLIAGAFYLGGLYAVTWRVLRACRIYRDPSGTLSAAAVLIFLLWFCNLQDAITYPLTGWLVCVLLGVGMRDYATRYPRSAVPLAGDCAIAPVPAEYAVPPGKGIPASLEDQYYPRSRPGA